MPKEYFITS